MKKKSDYSTLIEMLLKNPATTNQKKAKLLEALLNFMGKVNGVDAETLKDLSITIKKNPLVEKELKKIILKRKISTCKKS